MIWNHPFFLPKGRPVEKQQWNPSRQVPPQLPREFLRFSPKTFDPSKPPAGMVLLLRYKSEVHESTWFSFLRSDELPILLTWFEVKRCLSIKLCNWKIFDLGVDFVKISTTKPRSWIHKQQRRYVADAHGISIQLLQWTKYLPRRALPFKVFFPVRTTKQRNERRIFHAGLPTSTYVPHPQH